MSKKRETATVVLLASVPGLLADVRAFRAARPCSTAGPVVPGLDCLRSVPATVEGKVIREQTKNNEYTLMLRGCGWLRLAGTRNCVMRTFQLVGLDTVIGCYSTLSGALNA
ncbi:hypothetical protein AB0K74_26485 [Streptomyces sp. NPDC056159]|uniref:hypothetical protein n=1 Tax=Streptomyces sp. NPDC056159 TaxID=3155537 RepID=UPI00343A4D48